MRLAAAKEWLWRRNAATGGRAHAPVRRPWSDEESGFEQRRFSIRHGALRSMPRVIDKDWRSAADWRPSSIGRDRRMGDRLPTCSAKVVVPRSTWVVFEQVAAGFVEDPHAEAVASTTG